MNPSNGKDYPGIMTRGDFLICILAAMGFFILAMVSEFQVRTLFNINMN